MRPNQKKKIGTAVIVFGLVIVLIVILVNRNGSQTPPATNSVTPAPGETVSAVSKGDWIVAADNLPAGTLITKDDIAQPPAKGQAAPPDAEFDPSKVIGCVTSGIAIQKGAPIHAGDLIGHITDVGIAGMIQPGMRAMSVGISGPGRNTLHDLVHIGDHVDIVTTFDQNESKVLVQDVRVLAVDVYGSDFPQTKIAMRGTFKADDRASAAPPPAAAPAGAAPAPGGAPGAPAATPVPPPNNGQPPPVPEPALTLEVTQKQATQLQLAIAATATIDYILLPHPVVATGLPVSTNVTPIIQNADTNRREVAPFAYLEKHPKPTLPGGGSNGPRSHHATPDFGPPPVFNSSQPPMAIPAQQVPETYPIPVYGDGQLIRTETVRKPLDR